MFDRRTSPSSQELKTTKYMARREHWPFNSRKDMLLKKEINH
jgi:hypothetical protein